MTAEIVVMNKVGVALASDSASTLKGPRGFKISNTAAKLFRLCDKIPVAVMIYGSAEFMGIPWETLLRLFKENHGLDTLSKLTDYGEKFLKFITDQSSRYPALERERYVSRVVTNRVEGIVNAIFRDLRKRSPNAGIPTILAIAKRHITAFEKWVNASPDLPDLPQNFLNTVRKAHLSRVKALIKKRSPRPVFPSNLVEKLANSILALFSKARFSDVSGVVISGYGEDEIFPSLIAYEIEGLLVDGFVKHRIYSQASITFKNRAQIVPFAQREMVGTFMEGIHPDLKQFTTGYVANVLGDYSKLILELPELKKSKHKAARKAALDKASAELVKRYADAVNAHSQEEHIQPIVSALGGLPKEELATMAETLVNLTSFKRKVSPDAETVGGPIDVAVISKSDGMVWIKKKRYFTAEFNED